jgi:hypothetical protein
MPEGGNRKRNKKFFLPLNIQNLIVLGDLLAKPKQRKKTKEKRQKINADFSHESLVEQDYH